MIQISLNISHTGVVRLGQNQVARDHGERRGRGAYHVRPLARAIDKDVEKERASLTMKAHEIHENTMCRNAMYTDQCNLLTPNPLLSSCCTFSIWMPGPTSEPNDCRCPISMPEGSPKRSRSRISAHHSCRFLETKNHSDRTGFRKHLAADIVITTGNLIPEAENYGKLSRHSLQALGAFGFLVLHGMILDDPRPHSLIE